MKADFPSIGDGDPASSQDLSRAMSLMDEGNVELINDHTRASFGRREFTIVGSLTAIALDLTRYHTLGNGISVELISSGLSIGNPSWLWTIDFLGGFNLPLLPRHIVKALYKLLTRMKGLGIRSAPSALARSRVFLCLVVVSCTLLATTVRPASALLFIPTQRWVASARTDFCIRGTPNMLWPAVLGANDTAGGKKLVTAVETLGLIIPGWQLYMAGRSAFQVPPAIMLRGELTVTLSNFSSGPPDTWVITPHVAVASHADYLSHEAEIAFNKVKGCNKRLRDFGLCNLEIATGGKFPAARTVCSNLMEVHDLNSSIEFPVLTKKRYWQLRHYQGFDPSKRLSATHLNLIDWTGVTTLNTTIERQAQAK
ncbi:hypothetical protein K458DRAFT_385896 [Lentithecium fluviatile CBS 122367]|uniref:Uncharacterized protein n=1 Tax=Lentithecium fluviatile CBS 122367 TaxID=1168545 RepID=A0A6G1J939_9PLEO|nr:hypothetical protein K458DRAFT_385896 [Lentithecium fluviatile CBS 122367]